MKYLPLLFGTLILLAFSAIAYSQFVPQMTPPTTALDGDDWCQVLLTNELGTSADCDNSFGQPLTQFSAPTLASIQNLQYDPTSRKLSFSIIFDQDVNMDDLEMYIYQSSGGFDQLYDFTYLGFVGQAIAGDVKDIVIDVPTSQDIECDENIKIGIGFDIQGLRGTIYSLHVDPSLYCPSSGPTFSGPAFTNFTQETTTQNLPGHGTYNVKLSGANVEKIKWDVCSGMHSTATTGGQSEIQVDFYKNGNLVKSVASPLLGANRKKAPGFGKRGSPDPSRCRIGSPGELNVGVKADEAVVTFTGGGRSNINSASGTLTFETGLGNGWNIDPKTGNVFIVTEFKKEWNLIPFATYFQLLLPKLFSMAGQTGGSMFPSFVHPQTDINIDDAPVFYPWDIFIQNWGARCEFDQQTGNLTIDCENLLKNVLNNATYQPFQLTGFGGLIYSNKEGRVVLTEIPANQVQNFLSSPLPPLTLNMGWNTLTILPQFLNKNLDSIKGNCQFNSILSSDSKNKWIDSNKYLKDQIPEELIASALFVQVQNQCTLSLPSAVTTYLPDLTVSNIDVFSDPNTGLTTIDFLIDNLVSVDADVLELNFVYGIYKGTLTKNQKLVGGSSESIQVVLVTDPAAIEVNAYVDPNNSVSESEENNNELTQII